MNSFQPDNKSPKQNASSKNKQATANNNIQPKNIFTKNNLLAQAKEYWLQYLSIMSRSFQLLTRESQEMLIKRVCQTVTLGLTSVALVFVYSFIPELIRIFLVPVAALFAWWLGSNLVTSVVLDRFDKYLNKEG